MPRAPRTRPVLAGLLPAALLVVALVPRSQAAQAVAVTFDDGPKLQVTPRLSPAERNRAILDQLAAAHVTAALFVTLGNGADRPDGLALLRAWGEAGHLVGNHTVSHLDLDAPDVSAAAYEDELLACDRVIRAVPGFRPWFRFTFLREGTRPDKREALQAFLRGHGYLNARVTLDTSDWRLDRKLMEVLAKDPARDLEPIRRAYVAHVLQRAGAFRALSRQLLGRDVAQVLLLHHGLLNALFLADVLAALRADGWRFVSPEEAYRDPIYALEPAVRVPGQSLLVSLARSRGFRGGPELERLLDDGDAEIQALARQGY